MNVKIAKALSSPTRVGILAILRNKGGMTPTDIANRIKKHITTVREHLEILVDAGLVEKDKKPGRKFVFYRLTERGERVVRPMVDEIALLATMSIFIFLFSFASIITSVNTEIHLKMPATKSIATRGTIAQPSHIPGLTKGMYTITEETESLKDRKQISIESVKTNETVIAGSRYTAPSLRSALPHLILLLLSLLSIVYLARVAVIKRRIRV